jgi:putative ABC transport system ATP-binding protein
MDTRIRPEQCAPAAQALSHLLEAAGLTAPSAEIERTLGHAIPAEGEEPLTQLEWIALAGEAQGLRLLEFEADLEGALEQLQAGVPLLLFLPAGGPGGSTETHWVVLRRRRGSSVEFALDRADGRTGWRKLPLRDLPVELGVGPEERHRWLGAQVAEPSSAAESPSSHGQHMPPWTRLLRLLRPDRADILTVVVFSMATGVLLLAVPIAVQALVNFVALGGAIPPLLVVVLLLFLGLGAAGVLIALQNWIVEILQRRIFVRMVADLASRLPRVAVQAHDRIYGPELVNRFFDVVTIQKVGAGLLLDGLSVLLSVMVGLIVLAFYHPILLAFDILLLAIIALIVLGPVRRGIDTSIQESKAKYALVAWLEDLARNPMSSKLSGVQPWIFENSDRLARSYLQRRKSHFRVVFGQVVAAIGLQVLASTALLGIGGWLVIQGSLTLGQLVAAELIVTVVVSSVAKMGKHIEGFYDLMAATDKVGQLLDLPLEGRAGEHHVLPEESAGAELELRHLRWAPPGAPPFERSVSVRVGAGERLGVCGHSGSGKRTLLEILWGLRRPDRGVARLDGRDLRDLALHSLRRTAALVAHVEVVEGTIRENVRLGRAFVTDDDLRNALRRVGLLDEIERLPQGVETTLTAHGRPLSESQLRRLQVARAIAGHPRLLLVADFFGRLSADNRKLVLDLLFDSAARWTLVIVSNEPDVLERCTRVLRLPEGLVQEGSGDPSSLLASGRS